MSDDKRKREIIEGLKGIDQKPDPSPAAEQLLDAHEALDERIAMLDQRLEELDGRPPRGMGHIVGGFALFAFAFVHSIVGLTIAYDNTRTWSGIQIPGDLTPVETLGEISYQVWSAAGCVIAALIATVLIILGALRRRD